RPATRPDLHSSPTRRSSDLRSADVIAAERSGRMYSQIRSHYRLCNTSVILRPSGYLAAGGGDRPLGEAGTDGRAPAQGNADRPRQRKSTRLNSSHVSRSYAV